MSNMNDDDDDNLRKNKRFSHNFDVTRVQNYFPHINPVIKVFLFWPKNNR